MGGHGMCGGKVGNSMRAIELLVRVSMVRPRSRTCLPACHTAHTDWHACRGAAAGVLAHTPTLVTPTFVTPTLVARDEALQNGAI